MIRGCRGGGKRAEGGEVAITLRRERCRLVSLPTARSVAHLGWSAPRNNDLRLRIFGMLDYTGYITDTCTRSLDNYIETPRAWQHTT